MGQLKHQQPTDNFTIIEKNSAKYFTEIQNSVLHLQQELFELQNECFKAWQNTVNANISLQKEFASKIGINFTLPDTIQLIIENVNKGCIDTHSTRNRILIAAIQNAKKNIKRWNENTDMLTKWNENMLQRWTPAYTSESKDQQKE